MITVTISINGNVIMARSAVRESESKGVCLYRVDDGSSIFHDPDDGAVKLAIWMLKTIKEQGVQK